MTEPEQLSEIVRNGAASAAERKVATAMVARWPSSALGTVEVLAGRAGVSGPTVLRYLSKLGFARFSDFQAAVVGDIEQKLGSPLHELDRDRRGTVSVGHAYNRSLLMQAENLRRAAQQAVPAEFDVMVDLLADPRLQLRLIGGRYSRLLAQRLGVQLGQVRPGVSVLEQPLGFAYDALVDFGPRDVLVVFDFRRYQPELMDFARGARRAGARVCLVTDTWRSPIAELAEAVLTGGDESSSPFASRVVATAQMEALVAAVVERDREAVRGRLARIEELRLTSGGDGKDLND